MQLAGQPVAAGAARLLVVALERAREVVVDDEPDVLLVDAEAERVGRDHDPRRAVVHERRLHPLALLGAHPAVVAAALDAARGEEVGERVDRLDGGGVDDPAAGLRGVALDQAQQQRLLLALARCFDDVIAQVRAIEADVDHRRIGDAELREDVVLDLDRRGRGQRQHRRPAERADRVAEAQVRRAKVVAPLRDAVGLVDDEQRDPHAAEPLAEARLAEPLGRHVGDARHAGGQARERGRLVARRERRVEAQHLHAEQVELVVLILHQRDQRRHDKRDAGQLERGELIAPATCPRRSA